MGFQDTQRRDEEVWRLAYRQGVEDAIDGLPEDPEPASILEPSEAEGAYRYMIVWNAYIEGRVDGATADFLTRLRESLEA